jgi:hypothetical protein
MSGAPDDGAPKPRLRSLEDLRLFTAGQLPAAPTQAYHERRKELADALVGDSSLAASHVLDRLGGLGGAVGDREVPPLVAEALEGALLRPGAEEFTDDEARRHERAAVRALYYFSPKAARAVFLGSLAPGPSAQKPWAAETFRRIVARLAAVPFPETGLERVSEARHAAYARPLAAVADAVAADPSLAARVPSVGPYLLDGLAYLHAPRYHSFMGDVYETRLDWDAARDVYAGLAAYARLAGRLPEGFADAVRSRLAGAPTERGERERAARRGAREGGDAAPRALVPVEPPAPRTPSPVLVRAPEPGRGDFVKAYALSVGGLVAFGVTMFLFMPAAPVGLLAVGKGLLDFHRKKVAASTAEPAGYDREDLEDVERYLEETRGR